MTTSVNQGLIATRLKLSTATVSKSLRNSPEIHPQTRAKVIDMANKLGYRPTSQRLDKEAKLRNHVLSIGLLIQTDAPIESGKSQNAMMVLAGMSEASYAANASVTVHYVPLQDRERISEPAFQPAAMRQGQLAGLVLEHYFPPEVIATLAQQLPCVTLFHNFPGLHVDCIDLDCAQAVALIMDHLYRLGHRRIGFLGGLNGQSWNEARFAGYIQSLVRLGLPFDVAIADPQMDSVSENEAMTKRIVELTRAGVTAWVTPSDSFGTIWYQRLTRCGVRIPQEVSLTGIDAIANPDVGVVLTSIRVPFEEMGRAATKRLMDRIREPASPIRRICFEGQLVEGTTTAPPPAAS